MITYRFNLDIRNKSSQTVIPVRLHDTDIRLCVELTEGKSPYSIPVGCTAVLAASKPDGTTLFNNCTIEQNILTYDFTEQTTAAVGGVDCEIRLYSPEEKLLTSPRFFISVDSRVTEATEETLSETERTALDGAIIAEEERETAEAARAAAEEERVAAEEARAQAERERDTAVSELMEEAERALEMAEQAGSATSLATEALEKANQADANSQIRISEHNLNTEAHSDLRSTLNELKEKINEVLDSDDATLDELHEIVDYIKSNKALIDAITTAKVNISDIINDLTSNVPSKPLSAAMGVVLKTLADEAKAIASTAQLTANSKASPSTTLAGYGITNAYTKTEVDTKLLAQHGVGSVYISESSISPASLYGGTWERIKDIFPLAAGDTYSAGSTGGSADAVVVSHTHELDVFKGGTGGINANAATPQRGAAGSTYEFNRGNIAIASTGESGTGKNMPPYKAFYMWKRIA